MVLHMTTNEARQNLTAAVARRTEAVQYAQSVAGPRKSAAAWRIVEQLDQAVRFAAQDVEMVTRLEMVGATEAEIQAAVQAA